MAVWHVVLLVFVVVIGTGHCSSCGCDGPDIDNAQTCESLFGLFEDALLSDESNTYKLRNLLYPSTTAAPELANITYHIQFTNAEPRTENLRSLSYYTAHPELNTATNHFRFMRTTVTGGSSEPHAASFSLPSCLCPGDASNRTLLNTSGTITLRYGWTNIGVYTFIHPALLNQLQLQLPFAIMRLVAPDRIPFLWNGYNRLPSTSLHLTISTDNFTCLPGLSEVDGALKRLTSYVSGLSSLGACHEKNC